MGAKARGARKRRSSRCKVISRVPHSTGLPVIDSMAAAMRSARWAPRVGIPRRVTVSEPKFRSRISWAMRVIARVISGAGRATLI